MTIPWGRVWLTLATVVAVALATAFILHYLGILVTA